MQRVAVIYNEPKHTPIEEHWLSHSGEKDSMTHPEFRDSSEFGVLEQMNSIAEALQSTGHEVLTFSADDEVMRLCNFLATEKPDVIFNCCESILGQSSLEMNVAAVYELFGIPYTGSPALTLGIALNKALTKDLLLANGISTPRHLEIRPGALVPRPEHLEFPLIVKPIKEDASIGIDDKAIVYSLAELRARVQFVHDEFRQAALVEEFIDGRELNVGVIGTMKDGLTTLPISEITFDAMPLGAARIVSYEAKWVEESPLYKTTVAVCPAMLDIQKSVEASELALRAANVLGIRDYGRVDMRLRDRDGKLFVLEANPNPDISEDAGFMRAARESGRTFSGTINEIVSLTIERSAK
jgi:D-alanine-D-alanine ligase